MKTKAEVYQVDPVDGGGYWVYTCIQMANYYKHMDKSKVHCKDKEAVSDAVWNVLNKKVCPECGHVFVGNGWDGIDTHWKAEHEHIMSYENAWPLLQDDRYSKIILDSTE